MAQGDTLEKEQQKAHWQELLHKANELGQKEISAAKIYQSAPHEKMKSYSAAVGGPPVGMESLEELLRKVKEFVKMGVESQSEMLATEEGIKLLEMGASQPDTREFDKALANFTQQRIETFRQNLSERERIANKPLSAATKQSLEIPMAQMSKIQTGELFGQGKASDPQDMETRMALNKFSSEYPAVFYRQTLRSIEAKTNIDSNQDLAYDPMVPIEELRRSRPEKFELPEAA